MDTDRSLSDADIKAIVDELQSRMVQQFYTDLGKGVFAWIKRVVITSILALVAYGAVTNYKS